MIAEYNGANQMMRRYVHGPGVDNPLVWYEGAGTSDRRYLHTDERGSVTAVSNGSGALLGINSYDEYGIPGGAGLGRFRYTGQTWLPEIGLYYYKARIYSPTHGRFMQTDPIGYADGMNMYNYVGGDPVNLVDPTRLDDEVMDTSIVTGKRIKKLECVVCGNTAALIGGVGGSVGGGPGSGLGGSLGGSPPPPQNNEEESDTCKSLRLDAKAGRAKLPGRVATERTRSDPVSLRFYQLTYEDNARDLWLARYLGGGVAGLIAKRFGADPKASTTIGGAATFGLEQWREHYEASSDAIENRLKYLKAVADGTCPSKLWDCHMDIKANLAFASRSAVYFFALLIAFQLWVENGREALFDKIGLAFAFFLIMFLARSFYLGKMVIAHNSFLFFLFHTFEVI